MNVVHRRLRNKSSSQKRVAKKNLNLDKTLRSDERQKTKRARQEIDGFKSKGDWRTKFQDSKSPAKIERQRKGNWKQRM